MLFNTTLPEHIISSSYSSENHKTYNHTTSNSTTVAAISMDHPGPFRSTIIQGDSLLLAHFHSSITKRFWGVQRTPGHDLKCGQYALSQSLASRAAARGELLELSYEEYIVMTFIALENMALIDQDEQHNISAYVLQQRLRILFPELVLAVAKHEGKNEHGTRLMTLSLTHAEDFERLENGAEVLFIHNRMLTNDMNHWEGIGEAGHILLPQYQGLDGEPFDIDAAQFESID